MPLVSSYFFYKTEKNTGLLAYCSVDAYEERNLMAKKCHNIQHNSAREVPKCLIKLKYLKFYSKDIAMNTDNLSAEEISSKLDRF
jgi:hypothetical protein